jgi:hypothetical protein
MAGRQKNDRQKYGPLRHFSVYDLSVYFLSVIGIFPFVIFVPFVAHS